MRLTDSAKEKIILSLDVSTEKEAIDLVLGLKEHVGFFKIGLELLNSAGIGIVRRVVESGGRVFLDGKFNDIPNTVAGASKAVTRLRVKMFNVHVMGGIKMMEAAVQAAKEEASMLGIDRPCILGVTILTSIDQEMMNEQLRISGTVEDQVVHLTKLATTVGLDGVVASPHEIEAIRKNVCRKILIVTPAVRPQWAVAFDQKRIMTPSEAILKGASYLVIGRPITNPPPQIGTPVDAAKLIAEEMSAALEKVRLY